MSEYDVQASIAAAVESAEFPDVSADAMAATASRIATRLAEEIPASELRRVVADLLAPQVAARIRKTPGWRKARGVAAARAIHEAGKTNTGPAREAFWKKLMDQVDPDKVLPEEVRQERAEQARKDHFKRMSEKSLAKRRANAAKRAANGFPGGAG